LKKLVSILLAFLFVYNTIGFLVIHPFLSIYIKKLGLEQSEDVSKDKMIELIVLNKEDILLRKVNYERINEKEFLFNDEMYDIVKEVEKDSNLFLYCINDKREKSLFSELFKMIDDNIANKKQRNSSKNILKQLISEPANYLTEKPADASNLVYKIISDRNYSPVWKEVITPPPQQII